MLILLAMLLCGAAQAQNPLLLRRVPAAEGWDVVARLVGQSATPVTPDGRFVWTPRQRLEVLFENGSAVGGSVRLVSEPGPNDDCYARIERMTTSVLVISCIGEKWATYENHEYVYNPQTRKLVRQFAYLPLGALQVRPEGTVMADFTEGNRTYLRVAIDSAGSPRVAGSVPAPAEGDAEASFGAIHLARQKNRYGSEHTVIAEGSKIYAPPQTDQATWKARRPDDVKSFLHPDQAEMNEEIGPHQWVGGRLWFGKTFYNSEGATGVGGFGYFDTARRAFQLYAPREIWRWSASAMLVETDAVWLALYRRGEYGNYPGGLLRWDRQSGSVRQFAMDQVGVAMARVAGVLCIGTTDGLVVLRGDTPASYLVDRAADGRWEIAERNR